MKMKFVWAVSVVLVVLGGIGLKGQTASDSKPSPSAASSRSEFMASVDRQMKELDARLAELGKKADGLKDDAHAKAEELMAQLRSQRDTLGKKFR